MIFDSKYLTLTRAPEGSVNYFTISLNIFQVEGVANFTSNMETLDKMTRKVTNFKILNIFV